MRIMNGQQVQILDGGRGSLDGTLLLCFASPHSWFVIWIGCVSSVTPTLAAASPHPLPFPLCQLVLWVSFVGTPCSFSIESLCSSRAPFWDMGVSFVPTTHPICIPSMISDPPQEVLASVQRDNEGWCVSSIWEWTKPCCTVFGLRWIWALQSYPCQLSFNGVPL